MNHLPDERKEAFKEYYNGERAIDVSQTILNYASDVLKIDGIDAVAVVKAMPIAIALIIDQTEELKQAALESDPYVIGMISNLTLADLKFAMNIDPSAIYSVDDKTLNTILNVDTIMYIKSIPELDSGSILRACGRYEF